MAYCPRSLLPTVECTIRDCAEHDEARSVPGLNLAHILRRRHAQAALAKTVPQHRDAILSLPNHCPECRSRRHLSPNECLVAHPICTACGGNHATSVCWLVRPDLREDFYRRNPNYARGGIPTPQLRGGRPPPTTAPVSPFANVPGEPPTFYRVTREALHLIERVQPEDAIPDITLQTLGKQEVSFQLWIASILTELALLRHATGTVLPSPRPTIARDPGHALHGLRRAHYISDSTTASPPPTSAPYIDQIATYVDIAHRLSRAHAVVPATLDARGRAPPPNLTI